MEAKAASSAAAFAVAKGSAENAASKQRSSDVAVLAPAVRHLFVVILLVELISKARVFKKRSVLVR